MGSAQLDTRQGAYDAIVIGAGHNGLVVPPTSLGRGMRVVVLERERTVGRHGRARTSFGRGVRVPTLAHTVGRFAAAIARELGLRAHGLRLTSPRSACSRRSRMDGRSRCGTTWTGRRRVGRQQPDQRSRRAWVIRSSRFARACTGARTGPDLGARPAGSRRALPGRCVPRHPHGPGDARPDAVRRTPVCCAPCRWPCAILSTNGSRAIRCRAAVAARGVLLTGMAPRMPGTAAC